MLKIDNTEIGLDRSPYFIADIAANHDGSLDRAYKLIDLAKESGAHAAKFQNFIASKIVSKAGFGNLTQQLSHQASWKKSVYETYEAASLSWEWTARLKARCDEVGISYFTSPYDFDSVEHVDPFVSAYKIGSGDITWHEIISFIAGKGKPVLIATGASEMHEVELAVDRIRKKTSDVILMQCNTNYTASIENFRYINLNVLKTYATRFKDLILGLSDHTFGHATVLGAIPLGARVFEKHFTDDNGREGPDHKFAMNPVSWREMVDRADEVFLALGDGQKKIEPNEKESAVVQRRSLWFTRELDSGHIIERGDLAPLRPENIDGIPPYREAELIGKRLARRVTIGEYIREEDLEE